MTYAKRGTMPKDWTEEQLQYLRDNYKTMTHKEIGVVIGRTDAAVRNKAYDLRLGKADYEWSAEEIEKLKEFYAQAGADGPIDLIGFARSMGRMKSNICRKARQLELGTNVNRQCTDEFKKSRQHPRKDLSPRTRTPEGISRKNKAG